MATHEILGGRVLVYRRENSKKWQCSTRINGRNWRMSTGEESLAVAKEFAEDWFFRMKVKEKAGGLKDEKTFKDAAKRYLEEYDVVTGGTRNRTYVDGNERRLRLYLTPFFGDLGLSEVTAGKVQEYRVMRYTTAPEVTPAKDSEAKPVRKLPAKNTLHQEIVTLRQVLKTAIRHGWLTHLPDLSAPYKSAEKISHRAWFSAEEYKRLYGATRKRAEEHRDKRFQWNAEQLHDYVLFMANTGLRPDEANRLQYRDVEIVEDEETKDTILLIQVDTSKNLPFLRYS